MLFIVCTQLNGLKYWYLLFAHSEIVWSINIYCLLTVSIIAATNSFTYTELMVQNIAIEYQ